MAIGFKFSVIIAALIVTLMLAACNREDSSIKPLAKSENVQNEHILFSLDKIFDDLNEAISSFGGMYYNSDGDLVVALTSEAARTTRVTEIEPIITRIMGKEVYVQSGIYTEQDKAYESKIIIEPVKYTFRELQSWKDELAYVMSEPGVVWIDNDEMRNKVVIGVLDIERLEEEGILDSARRLVPYDAVEFVKAGPIVPTQANQDIRNQIRPIPAGVKVERFRSNGTPIGPPGHNWCTMGFNVTRYGMRGFLMNSHCTAQMGSVNGTNIHQLSGSSIGVEVFDPAFWTSVFLWVCPWGKQCRYSDSAFFGYHPNHGQPAGTQAASGWVAPVSWYNTSHNNGSFTIPNWNPWVRNPVWISNILAGTTVRKVGARTGGTQGQITQTCFDTGQAGTSFVFKCQYRATYYSRGGDSGSPVFGLDARHFYGLNWGAFCSGFDCGGDGVFSPIAGVRQDLGDIKVEYWW